MLIFTVINKGSHCEILFFNQNFGNLIHKICHRLIPTWGSQPSLTTKPSLIIQVYYGYSAWPKQIWGTQNLGKTAKSQQAVEPLSTNKSLLTNKTWVELLSPTYQNTFAEKVCDSLTNFGSPNKICFYHNKSGGNSFLHMQAEQIGRQKIYKPQNIHSLAGLLYECKMAESNLPLAYQKHVVTTNTTCTANLWLLTKSLTTTQT